MTSERKALAFEQLQELIQNLVENRITRKDGS